MSADIYFEILTKAEFAKRMKVGRTTINQWMKDNILVQGKHFFKHKRVLLFMWCKEIIATIFKNSKESDTNTDPVIKPPPVRKKGNSSMKINLDYRSKGNYGRLKERSKKPHRS